MKKFLQKKLKDQKGMTLIELLAVIVIIAIIAAIAIPAIGNIIENSRAGAIKSDASNIMQSADLYFTEVDDADGVATVTEMKAEGYLDDAGSFPDTASVTQGATGAASTFSGTATVGNVTLAFASATRDNINTLQNNRENIGDIDTISVPAN